MPTITKTTDLIFETLPTSLLALTNSIFKNSLNSIAILQLGTLSHPEANISKSWLHTDELARLAQFTFEKRYREWLGGRVCAKQSVRMFLSCQQKACFIPEHTQYAVLSKESGQPYFSEITGTSFSLPKLSISHSKGYAAAMVSSSACGIDIQFSADNLIRVLDKFCSVDEESLLQQKLPKLSVLARLTLLWSAKEAAKKMLSPGGIPGFHDLHFYQLIMQNQNDMIFSFSLKKTSTSITVTAAMMGDSYAIAICCETDLAGGAC